MIDTACVANASFQGQIQNIADTMITADLQCLLDPAGTSIRIGLFSASLGSAESALAGIKSLLRTQNQLLSLVLNMSDEMCRGQLALAAAPHRVVFDSRAVAV